MATSMGLIVLGPVVADRELGGAGPWGFILASLSTGFVVGGVIALRIRPVHPLRAGQIALLVAPLTMVGLALDLPVWAIAAGAFCAGIGLELFGVFWELSLQQHVPRDKLSRVSSYDALGSIVAMPLGQIVAGPLSDAIGVTNTIWFAVALFTIPTALCLLVPDVRNLRRLDLPTAAHSTTA
jgi:hypothetical protein